MRPKYTTEAVHCIFPLGKGQHREIPSRTRTLESAQESNRETEGDLHLFQPQIALARFALLDISFELIHAQMYRFVLCKQLKFPAEGRHARGEDREDMLFLCAWV